MARVRLALAARHDLREIRNYSKSAFGATVAGAYMEGMRAVFRLLREQRRAGRAEHDLGHNLRSFSYRSHRIYYVPDPQGVLILRVLHHSQEVEDVFGADQ